MNTTLIKTDQRLMAPQYGFDKYIVNFPGGLSAPPSTTIKGLKIKAKGEGAIRLKIAVYNGTMINSSNSDVFGSYITDTYTDEYGNVVRVYDTRTYWSANSSIVHFTQGVTRIEVLDISTRIDTVYYGADNFANAIQEGGVDILQYAILDVENILCRHNKSWGDLSSLQDKSTLKEVTLTNTLVTGDIAAFKKSAAVGLTKLQFSYCYDVYGRLEDVLDAMVAREDVRGQTLTDWQFSYTKVTYGGALLNRNVSVTFDNEGNYTVS